jgi:chitin synthase
MYTAVPMQQFVPFVPLVRRPTIRQVPLTPQGNLVVDVPVPDFLMRFRQGSEFSHLRYSAVTCDPDEFGRRGFTLRQQEYGRPTELFVVVTM